MIIEKSIEAIAGEAVSKLLSRRITYLLLIVGMSCYFIGTQTSTFLDWTTSKVSNVLASQGYHWTNHLGKGQTVWVNYEGAPLRMDATSGSKKTETLSKGTTLIFLSREDGANKIKAIFFQGLYLIHLYLLIRSLKL